MSVLLPLGLTLVLVAALVNHLLPWHWRRIEALAVLVFVIGIAMVVFGIGDSLTSPPVMLYIEDCRTFRDGAFVADVKFVGEPDLIVLIFRH